MAKDDINDGRDTGIKPLHKMVKSNVSFSVIFSDSIGTETINYQDIHEVVLLDTRKHKLDNNVFVKINKEKYFRLDYCEKYRLMLFCVMNDIEIYRALNIAAFKSENTVDCIQYSPYKVFRVLDYYLETELTNTLEKVMDQEVLFRELADLSDDID